MALVIENNKYYKSFYLALELCACRVYVYIHPPKRIGNT